jgi:hypothetical protein
MLTVQCRLNRSLLAELVRQKNSDIILILASQFKRSMRLFAWRKYGYAGLCEVVGLVCHVIVPQFASDRITHSAVGLKCIFRL